MFCTTASLYNTRAVTKDSCNALCRMNYTQGRTRGAPLHVPYVFSHIQSLYRENSNKKFYFNLENVTSSAEVYAYRYAPGYVYK